MVSINIFNLVKKVSKILKIFLMNYIILLIGFSGQYKMYYDKALVVVKSDIEDLAFQFNLELENNEFAKAENTLKQIRMKKIALNEFVDENFYGNIGIKIHSPIAITKGKKRNY